MSMPTPQATPRNARPQPDHEPTPTDFMLYHQWPAEPPAQRAPLPMLPMPPVRPAGKKVRRPALAVLRMAARMPRRSGVRLSTRARIAALAASTLLCGALFASAVLWVTHHHSAAASTATLALHRITLRA
jgi:hypothetical protein